MQQSVIDLFKKYKLQDLHALAEKKGKAKWTHEKAIGRKVLYLEGTVGSSNYLKFPHEKQQPLTHQNKLPQFSPNRQRYLYIQCCSESGHSFSFVLTIIFNSREYKVCFNSLAKQYKRVNNQYVIPIDITPNKWSIVVIDIWSVMEDLMEGKGKDKEKERQMVVELVEVELRSTLKVKGMSMSNVFYEADDLPKDLMLPLKGGELFYDNYRYYLINGSEMTIEVSCMKISEEKEKDNEEKGKRKEETKILEEQSIQNKTLISAKSIEKSKMDKSQHKSKLKETPKSVKISVTNKEDKGVSKSKNGEKDKARNRESNKEHSRCNDEMEVPRAEPKPSGTIEFSLEFQQGCTLSIGEIRSIEQCLITPDLIYTHKPITLFKKISPTVIIVAYNDATIAYFHLFAKTPLKYFQTELELIIGMEVDSQGILIVWGLDKLKRWILMIIEEESILFRQVSNYELSGMLLVGRSFKEGIITFGKESIRVWNVKKQMIVGSNLYLGEFARNTQFTSGVVADGKALIVSSHGNLFTIKLETSEIESIVKLEDERVDHIQKLASHNLITVTQSGLVKVLSPLLQVLFQTNLHCRIKHLVFKNQNQIILNHYDGTTGRLLLSQGKYQFLHRCHRGEIIDLKYHPRCKRLVSISEDSTIRVWRMVKGGAEIEQEYEFQVHAESMGSLSMCEQYSFIVGFEAGIIRKFDLKKFEMVEQRGFEMNTITKIVSSKGDLYTLVSDGSVVYLLNGQLNILSSYKIQPQSSPCLGFNSKTLSFYISTSQYQLSIFSLKSFQKIISLQVQSTPKQVTFQNQYMSVLTDSSYIIYKNNRFQRLCRVPKHDVSAVEFPLFAMSVANNLILGVESSLQFREELFVPEPLNGLVFSKDEEQMIFGWGRESHTIYGWRFQTRNIHLAYREEMGSEESWSKEEDQPEIIIKNIETTSRAQGSINPELVETLPAELKPLYPSYQSFFPESNLHENQFLTPVIEQQPEYTRQPIIKCENIHTQLIIGFDCEPHQSLKHIIWNLEHRYKVYPSGNDLIVQFFSQPIKQQIFHQAFKPERLRGTRKYFSFSVGNSIWLYYSDSVKFYKSISMEGEKILTYEFSRCEGYLILVLQMKKRIVLTILDILTTNIVVSSYAQFSDSPLLSVSPFKSFVEFVMLINSSLVFYRVTSIQTLQTQSIDLNQVVSKTGRVNCITHARIGKDQLILLGTNNGSIILVDSRSASLTLVCISVVKASILEILYLNKSLILVTNSVNMYVWQDICDVGEVAEKVAEKVEDIITLDSIPVAISKHQHRQEKTGNETHELQSCFSKLIAVTKLGVEWLIDTEDLMTVKLSSTHTKPITSCEFPGDRIIIGSQDGTVKITNPLTLQVQTEFFKPKKVVTSLLYLPELDILIASHSTTLCFYKHNLILGSCELESPAVAMRSIRETRNIIIGTKKEIIMVYLVEESPLKIEMRRVSDFASLVSLEINPYNSFNVWLCSSWSGKVNVWTRKILKRQTYPVQQLANIHQVQYYLVDNFHPTPKSKPPPTSLLPIEPSYCKFTSLNTYLCANQLNLFQRNYNEHIIIRQLSIGRSSCLEIFDDKVVLGDKEGYVWIIDKHGMVVEKTKVMEEVRGMVFWGREMVVFGEKVAKCIVS